MNNTTLIKVELNSFTVDLRLVHREMGTHAFSVSRGAFSHWMDTDKLYPYTERDISDVLTVAPYRRDELYFSFQFAEYAGNGLFRLVEQSFIIPLAEVQEWLTIRKGAVRHLECPWLDKGQTKLVWHVDHDYMQPILSDKRKRNAFRKAMRDRFAWRDSTIQFYPDGHDSFYFYEEGGINGGLILHKLHDGRYEYSVHT